MNDLANRVVRRPSTASGGFNKQASMMSVGIACLALALSACGGSDGSDGGSSSGGSGGGTTASPPTAGDALSTCAGTAASTTQFDVFLNTAEGIDQSVASRTVTDYGGPSAAKQCISVAGSTAQADTTGFQAVTNDGWDNTISYFDPTGTSASGGEQLNEQMFVTCASGQLFRHVAISNPTAAPTLARSGQAAALSGKTLVSYTCPVSSGGASLDPSSKAVFGSDGTVTVDGGDAMPVDSLFSSVGYTSGTKLIHWYLYQVTVGSIAKQVVVHTRYDSSNSTPYNIDVFMTGN